MVKEDELVQFGVLAILPTRAQKDHEDWKSGFNLKKGELFLDLQLMPVAKSIAHSSKEIQEGLLQIAGWIQKEHLGATYILSITHEKMADLLSRNGVSRLEALDLPEDYVQRIRGLYQYSQGAKQGKPMGKLFICFETQKDYLKRFGIVN